MLDSKDKQKIVESIDIENRKILDEVENYINRKMSESEIIDRVIKDAVNRFTPKSKMMLSTVYDMLREKTFNEEFFKDVSHQAAFYKINIMKELNEKFDFNIPSSIDYEESKIKIEDLIKSGVIIVIGSAISISLKKIIPIGVSVIIAGIMLLMLKNKNISGNKDLKTVIDEYLRNVKESLLSWVDSVAEYYDERIEQLKENLNKN